MLLVSMVYDNVAQDRKTKLRKPTYSWDHRPDLSKEIKQPKMN